MKLINKIRTRRATDIGENYYFVVFEASGFNHNKTRLLSERELRKKLLKPNDIEHIFRWTDRLIVENELVEDVLK